MTLLLHNVEGQALSLVANEFPLVVDLPLTHNPLNRKVVERKSEKLALVLFNIGKANVPKFGHRKHLHGARVAGKGLNHLDDQMSTVLLTHQPPTCRQTGKVLSPILLHDIGRRRWVLALLEGQLNWRRHHVD